MLKNSKSFARFAKALTVIFVSQFSLACSDEKLSRDEAAEIMNKNENVQKAYCTMDRLSVVRSVVKKPEFRPILDKAFCKANYVVTGITQPSKTTATADASILIKSDQAAVENWLKAFDALERRLLVIKGRKKDSRRGPAYALTEYIDPTDGEIFSIIHGAHVKSAITQTPPWNLLQNEKGYINLLRGKDTIEQYPNRVSFQLYDDGWREVKRVSTRWSE